LLPHGLLDPKEQAEPLGRNSGDVFQSPPFISTHIKVYNEIKALPKINKVATLYKIKKRGYCGI
jgi:hypothetical protein